MSDDEIVAGPPGVTKMEDVQVPDVKPKYRSWRKKYRKMKTRFDDVMKDSNSLFVDEQKLEALSKRLQEQNDQLLDLLLDLNSTLAVPHSLRYNLSSEAPTQEEKDMTLEMANNIIKNGYSAVQHEAFPQPEFSRIRADLEAVLARKGGAQSLADLEATIPHPLQSKKSKKQNGVVEEGDEHAAFLTSKHEEQYLARMDAKLEPAPLSEPRPASPPALSKLSTRELDREIELRNPFSVHNWLKKHGTVPDLDAASETGAASTPANKRRNLAKQVGDRAIERAKEQREEGSPASMLDAEDELAGDDVTPGSRKKAKDDDQTYRPKGGRSKAKRKRDDASENGGGKKKPRISGVSAAGDGQ